MNAYLNGEQLDHLTADEQENPELYLIYFENTSAEGSSFGLLQVFLYCNVLMVSRRFGNICNKQLVEAPKLAY